MTAKKTPAAKSGAAKAAGTGGDTRQTNRPANDEERREARITGRVDRSEVRSARAPGQHPSRTHDSNLVEVESMPYTRIVDGRRYGPFTADAPRERRMVPVSLQVTFNLPLSKKAAAKGAGHMEEGDSKEVDSGKGVTRLSGIEVPNADEDNRLLSDEEKLAAAQLAGLTQEEQLERRQQSIDARRAALINSGAIEGSEAERERLGAGHSKEK